MHTRPPCTHARPPCTHAPHAHTSQGSRLLERSLAACADDPAVSVAALHVHEGDEDAQAWYLARGFSVAQRIPNYYRRLEPPDALLLTRQLVGGGSEEAAPAAEEETAAPAVVGG